jgi:hypothetical protein
MRHPDITLSVRHAPGASRVSPAEIKALAAYLSALADSPTPTDVDIGGLHVSLHVGESPEEADGLCMRADLRVDAEGRQINPGECCLLRAGHDGMHDDGQNRWP